MGFIAKLGKNSHDEIKFMESYAYTKECSGIYLIIKKNDFSLYFYMNIDIDFIVISHKKYCSYHEYL